MLKDKELIRHENGLFITTDKGKVFQEMAKELSINNSDVPKQSFHEESEVENLELHPFLAQLNEKDLKRYIKACEDDMWDFLKNLGLDNTLALKVLDDVRANIKKNDIERK